MNPREFREKFRLMSASTPPPLSPPQPQMPSIPQMAMSLVKDGARWIKGGMRLVEDEVAAERLNICNSCEFYVGSRCSKCGCQMRVKTTLATSSCPIGKWGPVTGVTEIPASNQIQTNPPAS
jgi:hypothetical protein